jgi:hypothetical protein
MAIKNTKLGGTDWDTPSARVKPTDLNDTLDDVAKKLEYSLMSSRIHKTYSGTDLNVSASESGKTTNTSTGTITISIDAGDYDYLTIDFLGSFITFAGSGSGSADVTASATYRLDVSGGSSILNRTIVSATASDDDNNDRDSQFANIVLYYAPTQTEKDEGFDLVFETEARVSNSEEYGSGGASVSLEKINIFRNKEIKIGEES